MIIDPESLTVAYLENLMCTIGNIKCQSWDADRSAVMKVEKNELGKC